MTISFDSGNQGFAAAPPSGDANRPTTQLAEKPDWIRVKAPPGGRGFTPIRRAQSYANMVLQPVSEEAVCPIKSASCLG